MKIDILGGGIAGVASALALTKWLEDTPEITIYEVRAEPSTIGGAINLTPNALRCLHHLGVLETIRKRGLGAETNKIELFSMSSGRCYAEVDFAGPDGEGFGQPKLKGLRIMRSDLQQAMLEALQQLPNVVVAYGEKVTEIHESAEKIDLKFEGGRTSTADLVIGGDGIHSSTRRMHVEPGRQQTFTGIAVTYGFAKLRHGQSLPWKDTSLSKGRQGTLLASFFEPTRQFQYLAAVMETADVQSRQGWKAKAEDQEEVRRDISQRLQSDAMPVVQDLIDRADEWFLYPVYKLPPGGKWCTARAILLGDAAHAMPPQGESTGIAMEDAIMFARILNSQRNNGLKAAFGRYEDSRRPIIEAAYKEATWRWNTVRDSSWTKDKLMVWMTPWILWWTADQRRKTYEEDMAEVDLEIAG